MIRTLAVTAALVVASTVSGAAQPLPAAPVDTAAAPDATSANARAGWLQHAAAFALRRAYHEIGVAQLYGGSPYLDAAKTHYRGALARLQRSDAGAAAEAMAASALARAAIAEHPAPAPRDLPTPPAVAMGGPAMRMRPPADASAGRAPDGAAATTRPMGGGMVPGGMMPGGMMGGGMMPPGGPGGWMGGRGMRGRHERFDATRLAEDARRAGTAEAKDLAQKALDADVARTRAAFAGNRDEAMREGRLAGDLARAVGALARAEHPPTFTPRTPGMRRRPTSDGIVGETGTPS